MRENRTHGSEGGDGESRFRPLSEQRVVIDAQIIAARVFSKEDTKSTKFGIIVLRTLRNLRGEHDNLNVADYSH